MGYWEKVSTASERLLSLLDDAAGEEWTLRGAVVTGESEDGTGLHVLTLRHKVGDVGLLLRLGFAHVSLDDPEDPVAWTSNYLDMRVGGSLPSALSLLFSEDGMGDTQEPLALDARPTSVEEDAEVLSAPFREVSVVEEESGPGAESTSSDSSESGSRDPRQSVEGRTPDRVKCDKCGDKIPREEAENFGSLGVGGDVWVHSGGCPE
jgi:hypothetical protein